MTIYLHDYVAFSCLANSMYVRVLDVIDPASKFLVDPTCIQSLLGWLSTSLHKPVFDILHCIWITRILKVADENMNFVDCIKTFTFRLSIWGLQTSHSESKTSRNFWIRTLASSLARPCCYRALLSKLLIWSFFSDHHNLLIFPHPDQWITILIMSSTATQHPLKKNQTCFCTQYNVY